RVWSGCSQRHPQEQLLAAYERRKLSLQLLSDSFRPYIGLRVDDISVSLRIAGRMLRGMQNDAVKCLINYVTTQVQRQNTLGLTNLVGRLGSPTQHAGDPGLRAARRRGKALPPAS